MAYCKECGAHVGEREKRCNVCGKTVERPDLIDKSQVEIVSGGAVERKRVLRSEKKTVDPETKEHTFRLFDKRIAILLAIVLVAQILSFLLRSVDEGRMNVWLTARSTLFFVSAIVAVLAIAMRARLPLKIALWGMAVSALVFLVVQLFQIDFSTAGKGVRWFSVIIVPILIGVWSALMLYEMHTGKRNHGLHTVLIALLAIAILLNIVTSLLGDVESSVGDLAITWQILEMAAKVCMLCVALMLYSNMGRLALEDKY